MCINAIKTLKEFVILTLGGKQLLALPKIITSEESTYWYVDIRSFVNGRPLREGIFLRAKEFAHLYYVLKTGDMKDIGDVRKLTFKKDGANLWVTVKDSMKQKTLGLPALAMQRLVEQAEEIVSCFQMDVCGNFTALAMLLNKEERDLLYPN